MIELAALATSLVTSFIVPLVKNGAEGLMDELKTRTNDAAADGLVSTAKRLWQRVRGKAEGTADQKVVELFEDRPDEMKGVLEGVVKQMLEADPEFRNEATKLLEAKEGGSTRWELMGEIVGVIDAHGATIHGGTMTAVNVHYTKDAPSAGEPKSPPES